MLVPLNFLKAAAKAIVKHSGNAVGLGFAGDLVVEYGFLIVEDIWDAWGEKRDDEERRAEIEEVAQASAIVVVLQVAKIVKEIAADQPSKFQQMLGAYLTQVPAMVQKSLRRHSDPTGRSVSANLIPRKAEDLLPFLPPKLPRFKPGDRPLPGVDLELEQLLDMGGFAEVWKARNPHMTIAPPVALNFCLDVTAAKVLRNEAAMLDRVMRQGKHPGIVQLLHTYLSSETPCLEYEYVADGDLAGIIKEKKLKPELTAIIVLRLAEIVGFAHQLNPPVVHRDLKPANILVEKIVLRIANFGFGGLAAAQAISEARSKSKFLVSALQGAYTPNYASPQQMRGDPPDPRDDVFSLGVIWYQMLTGNLLLGRPTGKNWRDKLAKDVPAKMLDLLATCFEDDSANRPVNAEKLAESLGGMLEESGQWPDPAVSSPKTASLTVAPKQQCQPAVAVPKPGDIITNSLGMKFAWIPPGGFMMGSPASEEGRKDSETQHEVKLTRGYYLGVYQVTQEEWQAVMGGNPSHFKGEKNLPVEQVSWDDCQDFLKRLSDKECHEYRLPTEAEWEYACRTGTTTPFYFGETISTDQANYTGNYTYGKGKKGVYRKKSTPVGSFPANAWGLHDMHGNVLEWCADWYGDYPAGKLIDPLGPETGVSRVLRGGSWQHNPKYCRSANRGREVPTHPYDVHGFRVARTLTA